MPETATAEQAAVTSSENSPADDPQAPLEISDLLVEDVSIDGMCGVY